MVKLFNNLFVTSKFNVAAKQNVAEPHQRIEPMERQKKESERFREVVFTANVRHFVRHHVLHILLVHIERQIDLRLYNAENEGGYHVLALIDVITKQHGCALQG